jgi:deoxyribonuclease-4
MIIGAHTSASGGLYKAVARAIDDQCESLQVFVKNNNRWAQRPWTDEEIARFIESYEASGLRGLVAHTSYLINLCSNKEENLKKSKDALEDELNRCAQLRVPYLVMHPGSHLKQGEQWGLETIATSLREVYEREQNGAWKDVTLLFENTAGQGTNLGYTLAHLQGLFELVHDPDRFGVCFDTCHAHAAGYDLTTTSSYEDFWKEFEATVGISRIKSFHMNDSKKSLGTRVDRHENIGLGEIGQDTFEWLVNDVRFAHIPGILETAPDDKGSFAGDVKVLKGLRA